MKNLPSDIWSDEVLTLGLVKTWTSAIMYVPVMKMRIRATLRSTSTGVEYEDEEELIIPKTNAVRDPVAVVIHLQYTATSLSAVVSPIWLEDSAKRAEPSPSPTKIVFEVFVHEVEVFYSLLCQQVGEQPGRVNLLLRNVVVENFVCHSFIPICRYKTWSRENYSDVADNKPKCEVVQHDKVYCGPCEPQVLHIPPVIGLWGYLRWNVILLH